jgi:V/A-type H+-transporting ATPase subunit C
VTTISAHQAYLRTRLAILSSQLLGARQLAELARLPLDELGARTGYDEAKADTQSDRLAVFERALMQSWLDELSALLRPLDGPARRLLTQWASRYELLNIKAIVRGKMGKLPVAEIERNLFQLPGYLSLNHDTLLHTDSVPDLLRQLQKTRYRRIATQALRRYEERPDAFLLDATLDQQFYSELIARAGQLTSKDSQEILDLIGRIVDRHNLVWSLRYRFNYGLQTSEVVYLAIDGGRLLNRRVLQHILQADSLGEALQRLPDSLLGHRAVPGQLMELEAAMQAGLDEYATHAMRQSPSVLTSVLAYLVLRYGDITAIYAIVHARVHGLSTDLLEEALDPLHEVAA